MKKWFLGRVFAFSACALLTLQINAGVIVQMIEDESELGPPTEFQFAPFREYLDDGTQRILTGVEVNYEGEAQMDVIVENFDATAYDEGEWSYDFYHSALFSFDEKAGFEDGGPFFFIGGMAIESLTGNLSAGDDGGFPFPGQGTPGEVVVTASTSGNVIGNLSVDADAFDFFVGTEPLSAKIGTFTEGLLTSPPLPNGFANISGRVTDLQQNGTLYLTYSFDVRGDLTADDLVDADDIVRLYSYVDSGDIAGDLNEDQKIDYADVDFLILDLLGSVYGDSNLDGLFNSSDLVTVFQAAEYEDDIDGNSTWATGDWNGDGEFASSDLVFVFQKSVSAGLVTVPEPMAGIIPIATGMGLCLLIGVRRMD